MKINLFGFKAFIIILIGSTLFVNKAVAKLPGYGDNSKSKKPNIVIILSDDQGYADVSYHHFTSEARTPAIDKIAKDGVVFTNGYVSAYVCAPTRAGLLTGRYQQRFGFYRAPDSRKGLPLGETTLADILKNAGYSTGVFGKWHLGIEPEYHPLKRGFEEFYGFLGHGGHDYFDLNYKPGDDKYTCIYRNEIPVSDTGYLTDNLAREACSFIERHSKEKDPFFLYLPFNAVHFPLEAPEEDIKKYNSGDKGRDIQLAMISKMDMAIEKVIEKLKKEGAYENTLLFFLTDNGGAKVTKAINKPLRDFKHSVYEGGIRVPFIVSWPEKFKHGKIDEPVISLDIMSTILAVTGINVPKDKIIDGKSLLPVIEHKNTEALHDILCWDGNDGIRAIRESNWKLVLLKGGKLELYNLAEDLSEENDLSKTYPDKVRELKSKFDLWRNDMASPMSESEK